MIYVFNLRDVSLHLLLIKTSTSPFFNGVLTGCSVYDTLIKKLSKIWRRRTVFSNLIFLLICKKWQSQNLEEIKDVEVPHGILRGLY